MELFSKPAVGALIEKNINGIDYILVQDRYKDDAVESGLIEIPAGKIREFENIFDCLRREVYEETGLDIIHIEGENEAITFAENSYKVINYIPFSCAQNIQGEYPIMVQTFICKANGELLDKSNESRFPRWITLKELQDLLEDTSKLYPMHVDTLKKYLRYKYNLEEFHIKNYLYKDLVSGWIKF